MFPHKALKIIKQTASYYHDAEANRFISWSRSGEWGIGDATKVCGYHHPSRVLTDFACACPR
jgi:hypothetical protein